jgi:DNA-binding GntR family transcriptional regulator
MMPDPTEHSAGELPPMESDARAYERIVGVLRESVAARRLSDGTVLLEGPVAKLFGSSRSPVRQAFEQLRADGILHRFRGRGLIVGRGPPVRVQLKPADFGLKRAGMGVARRPGWQRVYEPIERALIHHSVFGRYRVNEIELAREYQLSRAVARDALLQAHSLGIIVKDERSRWVTVPLDEKRLSDLFMLRESLEGVAIAAAVRSVPKALSSKMIEHIDAVRENYPRVSNQELDQLEQELHVDLIACCGNVEIIEALKRTRCMLILSKHVLGQYTPLPQEDPFLDEHRAVLMAVNHGSETGAKRALLHHLRSARPKLAARLAQFSARGLTDGPRYLSKVG